MKCPHCEYIHGWNAETLTDEDGRRGPFFRHPVELKRDDPLGDRYSKVNLYGCPSCMKTFIEREW